MSFYHHLKPIVPHHMSYRPTQARQRPKCQWPNISEINSCRRRVLDTLILLCLQHTRQSGTKNHLEGTAASQREIHVPGPCSHHNSYIHRHIDAFFWKLARTFNSRAGLTVWRSPRSALGASAETHTTTRPAQSHHAPTTWTSNYGSTAPHA